MEPRQATPARSLRKRDAACHITEECERLFCDTLRTVFLVEKNTSLQTSLVMDMHSVAASPIMAVPQQQLMPQGDGPTTATTIMRHGQPTPSTSPGGHMYPTFGGLLREYVEVWDYTAGQRFRGFVAEKDDGQRAMFVFFDRQVVGKDLKPGLMSLLELASSDHFDCSQLVACVDRTAEPAGVRELHRSLGWVGFELMLLDNWVGGMACTSDRWVFLGLDV